MEKDTWFKISSWGTIAISIIVIIGAFNPYIALYGDFYIYLTLIAGILGVFGALLSLGILPLLAGVAVSISLMFLTFPNF